jgi:beta-glucosidase
VRIGLDPNLLSYYHDGFHRWVTEAGEYEILVGASAADIRLSHRMVVTPGTMPRPVYTLDHTGGDLLKDPRGRIVVDYLTTRMGLGSLADARPDNFMAMMMRQVPIRKIINFSGGAVTPEALAGLLELVNSDLEPSEVRARLAGGGG